MHKIQSDGDVEVLYQQTFMTFIFVIKLRFKFWTFFFLVVFCFLTSTSHSLFIQQTQSKKCKKKIIQNIFYQQKSEVNFLVYLHTNSARHTLTTKVFPHLFAIFKATRAQENKNMKEKKSLFGNYVNKFTLCRQMNQFTRNDDYKTLWALNYYYYFYLLT